MQGREVTYSQNCNGGSKPKQKERGSWQARLRGCTAFTALNSPNFAFLLISKRSGWQCLCETSFACRRPWTASFFLPDSVISFFQLYVLLSWGTLADL